MIRRKKIIIVYTGKKSQLKDFGFNFIESNNEYERKANSWSDGYQTFYESIYINSANIVKSRLYNDLSNFEWTGYIERTDHYIKDLDNAGLLKIKEIEDWI